MKRNYHVIDQQDKKAERELEQFCQANGQLLLPLVELMEQARLAVDQVIEQVGRKTIETILVLSAEQVAGPRTPGKASGEIPWHGKQRGRVYLRDRQVEVRKPRLWRNGKRSGGEVAVPA